MFFLVWPLSSWKTLAFSVVSVVCRFLWFVHLVFITSLISHLSLLCWVAVDQIIIPQTKHLYVLHLLTFIVVMEPGKEPQTFFHYAEIMHRLKISRCSLSGIILPSSQTSGSLKRLKFVESHSQNSRKIRPWQQVWCFLLQGNKAREDECKGLVLELFLFACTCFES